MFHLLNIPASISQNLLPAILIPTSGRLACLKAVGNLNTKSPSEAQAFLQMSYCCIASI